MAPITTVIVLFPLPLNSFFWLNLVAPTVLAKGGHRHVAVV
jgi:hypothetical protein